jgi:type I restriction enzyme S subunit
MSLEGWDIGLLGEACSITIGGTPSRANPAYWDIDKSTENLWVSIRDLNQGIITDTAEYLTKEGVKNSNVKKLLADTILLSFKLTIGRVAIAGKDLYTNEAIAGLCNSNIFPGFLYYGLQQWDLLQDVDQAIKGATLNKQKLNKIQFNYPKCIKEQEKIAEVLSTIDRAIAQTEAIIAKQQRIKTGMMQDLLTKGIDENGNIRSEATHEFKDSAIGRIPVEWDVAPVSKYGSKHKPYLCTGPFGSSLNTKHWVEEGVPVLTIGSLGEGELIEKELLYITELTAKKLKNFLVEPSDIVFSRVADIGRSLVIGVEQKGWIISSNLMRLSLDNQTTSPIYLYINIAFNTSILDQLRIMCNSGGRDLINGAILSKILFPWASFEEQNRINLVLDQIDRNLLRVKQELKKLNCKKTGLMQDLLTGKVRVTNLLQ